MEELYLIFGLGNPGKDYQFHRHNIGFSAINHISSRPDSKSTKKFNSETTEIIINKTKVTLIKPLSYMNLSGEIVKKFKVFYKIDNKNIIIIHDDLDLEFSDIRTKFDGGSAGHNGIKNIIQHIGDDFTRIRVGIGHPRNINDNYSVTNYVLGNFSKEEKKALPDIYLEIQKIIVNLLSQTSDK